MNIIFLLFLVKNKSSPPPSSSRKKIKEDDEKQKIASTNTNINVIASSNLNSYRSIGNQEEVAFANLIQDFNNIDFQNAAMKDNLNNFSLSLEYNTLLDKSIKGEAIFGSDGYIEEEDDEQFLTPEENKLPKETIIHSTKDLHTVLYNKRDNLTFKITLNKIDLDNERVNIISDKFMIIILQYLYDELNDAMLELSDNCAEDRRKFFDEKGTNSNYLKTIELYIKRKNEFFSCVLSSLFYKINISQNDFNNSVNYFINIAEENEIVKSIKNEYDRVYKAGKKDM